MMDVFEGDTRNHEIIVKFMSKYFSPLMVKFLFWNYCLNRKAAELYTRRICNMYVGQ